MRKTTSRGKGVFKIGLMVPVGCTHHHHGSGRQAWDWSSSSSRMITSWPTQERENILEMAPVYCNLKTHPSDTYPTERPHLLILSKIVQPSGEQELYEPMALLTFKPPQRCWIRPLYSSSLCNNSHGDAGCLIMLCLCLIVLFTQ